MAEPELGIGVIGLGVVSRFYLAALARVPGVRLAGVCDVNPAKLAIPVGVPRHTDHHALLADPAVRAVVVTVPNDQHVEVCAAALAAGRHVCVEKPLALTVADARHLHGLADALGLVLFTAFHRRYNREVLALRDRLRGVDIDRVTVRYAERIEDHLGEDAWYLDPARCGGGCLADNGPNAFDVARLLAGPLRVTGARINARQAGVDRTAEVELAGAGGAEVLVELDWSFPGERKSVEVQLADGGTDRADMLHGHPEFKGSLWHEYVGVVTDFAERVRGEHGSADHGLATVELVHDAYAAAG